MTGALKLHLTWKIALDPCKQVKFGFFSRYGDMSTSILGF